MKNITRKQNFALFLIIVLSFTAIFLSWYISCLSGQTQNTYFVDSVFPNLMFNQPAGIVAPGDGTNRLFVIEQTGTIRVFENSQTVAESNVFLDISNEVLYGGEQGLLGLTFHPNYEANGYFYVNYVADNPRRTVIARYSVSPNNPDRALENSELVLLEVNQPFSNHNGGQLAFGPDGYLYIGLGDGGSAGDPSGNGQNRATLLGKILRIDIDLPSQGRNYGIPPDNPYSGNTLGYREEIYAYGLRNPWRFSFDATNGQLWVGDVGQSQREEVNIVEEGKNYGWNIMEGSLPYAGGNQTGLELPVWEYGRDDGIAIIGGYVYYGLTLPELTSKYIYGDFGSGKVWALQYDGISSPVNTLLADTSLSISSFGVDEQNELYICSLDGQIYALKTSIAPSPSPSSPSPNLTSTPSPSPAQTPSLTPTPTPTLTLAPTPIQTPSQSPFPSVTPVTSTPKPPSSENSSLLYIIIIVLALASASAAAFIIKKRRRK